MTRRLSLTLAAAAAVAALVVVAAVRARRGRDVLVVFPSVSGLRPGAPVTYLGADVGTVGRIDPGAGQTVVRLRIRRRDIVFREGDEPRLRTMGLLGDAAIDIRPGPLDAPRLERGDTLHGGGAAASPEPARMLEALMRGGPRPSRDSSAANRAAGAPRP